MVPAVNAVMGAASSLVTVPDSGIVPDYSTQLVMTAGKGEDKDYQTRKSLADELAYDRQVSVPFKGLEAADLSDWSQEGDANSTSKFLEYSQQELEDLRRSSMGGIKPDLETPNHLPTQSTPVTSQQKTATVGTNIPKLNFLQRTKPLKRNDITPPPAATWIKRRQRFP